MHLAPRMTRFGASESSEAAARARALREAGHKVIDFSIGEPDFPVADHVKQAIRKALDADESHYTAVGGTTALLDAIRGKFSRENGLEYSRKEVMASAGAKQVMFNAFAATVSTGDEVVVLRPYWISYPNQVKIAGGTPVFVEAAPGFGLDCEAIGRAITPKTRWVVLNSPNNPSGAAFSRDELTRFANVLKAHPHVLVMSDEIYEHLVYDGAKCVSLPAAAPELKDRTLVVNGVSKAYAMTGLRIGYAGGPAELIAAMNKLQSQSTSCPSSLGQAAAVEALNASQAVVEERRQIMQRRRDHFVGRLSRVQELRLAPPKGAMYLFCDARSLVGRTTPSGSTLTSVADFTRYLLDEFKVVVVQGAAYGMPDYFRISFATSMDVIDEGCDRITAACASLRPSGA